jgi:glycosyltransferase involved in cell wall biosynthesis
LKYSIIIPTLNEERLLPKLLGQLDNQTLKDKYDYEIIITDGGSTDKTLDIAKNFVDRIIPNQEHSPQNIAVGRNLGAKSALGDVLIFLNGDVVFQDAIKFFNYLEEHFINSDYLAFTCDVWIFPEEENLSDKIFHTIYNNYFLILNSLGVGMGRGECQVIKRIGFTEVGGYNEKYVAGEDFELYKRIRKLGKILFSKKVCVYESPRRFRRFGYIRVSFSWIINSFSVIFKKRSMHSEWEQVR